jgi:hypothetical protein
VRTAIAGRKRKERPLLMDGHRTILPLVFIGWRSGGFGNAIPF